MRTWDSPKQFRSISLLSGRMLSSLNFPSPCNLTFTEPVDWDTDIWGDQDSAYPRVKRCAYQNEEQEVDVLIREVWR